MKMMMKRRKRLMIILLGVYFNLLYGFTFGVWQEKFYGEFEASYFISSPSGILLLVLLSLFVFQSFLIFIGLKSKKKGSVL
ncbi:hypothetical protein NB545_09125 [Vibrio campbellii]|uniref:hypothetical protein n=1 Tax=Vibrio campbellii TaxID=680 RepID=UPI00215B9D10|nr:hypothetical protein [Vibrio campbellii]MCR9907633.1 hypothetical protein [Vibrio campbellii]